MILRRLTDALRKQDWVTVVIETLIVVFGVFIGLQVNNWNAARAERRLADDYTVRLIADLEQDLLAAQRLTRYYDAVTQGIVETDQMLLLPGPDPEALVGAAYRASEFMYTPRRRATWDQIVSSGDLDLLPNDLIASGLSDYYKLDEATNDTILRLQDTPYRLVVRSLIPLPVQLAIRDGCGDQIEDDSTMAGFDTDCQIAVDEGLLEDAARALMASEDLREGLRYQYSMVASVQVNNRGDVIDLDRLLAALKEEATP